MPSPTTIALGLGAPFALLVAWLALARLGPGRAWRAPSIAFSAVASLGAASAAAACLWGQSRLAPVSGSQWLGWLALLWGLAAATDAAALSRDPARHALRAIVLALAFALVFGRRLVVLAGGASGWGTVLGLALGAALACELAARLFRRLESPIAECAPMAAFAGASALALFAGYTTLSAVAGASALGFLVLAAGATRFAGEPELRAGAAVFATGWLAAIGLATALFASPSYPASLWALVALGLFSPAVVSLAAFARLGAAGRFAVAAGLALAPIALAAWLAWRAYDADPYA